LERRTGGCPRQQGKLAKLSRAIFEAPIFEEVMTDAERREVRLNALAELKNDDEFAFEQQRQAAMRDLS
jgi:hypothetical protein